MTQILISAAHKSSGKTTITTGICAALRLQGKHVQPFKKGPDYIDPMWLSTAAQRQCYNLDFWTQSDTEILRLYSDKSMNADISIIEANKGLHDGLDLEGANSNAALAKLLNSPVIMVVDCRGTIRGVAPLLLGYQQFDPNVKIEGVILNFVGGSRHEQKLRQVIKRYTDIEVIGAIARNEALELEERYLGLTPSNEDSQAMSKIQGIAKIIADQVDMTKLTDIAASLPDVPTATSNQNENYGLKIAYAKDEAFGFYYADDIETFNKLGATLIPFDTLNDQTLPTVDGLFLGGGFPEKKLHQLEKNQQLRNCIHAALNHGLPAYAECGGLMYLCNRIQYQDQVGEMVGFIDANCVMTDKPLGRGYVQFKENEHALWPTKHELINAHEFHYSYLDGLNDKNLLSFDIQRGRGISNQQDGLRKINTLACYAHQRNTLQNPWISKFLQFVQSCKLNSVQTG